jgi:DNA topoisomerase-1
MKKVLIVESPSKAKTISTYLGKEYKVLASGGHIVDLPKSEMGVDINNKFEAEWVFLKGKKLFFENLKKELKSTEIFILATDPDREGEAISYHIVRLLNLSKNKYIRIRPKEISKEEIISSLNNPDIINQNLVESQISRRILDRITGYTFSPTIWRYGKNLSAGRVQSPVLRWICEREKEIKNFKTEKVYKIYGIFKDKLNKFNVKATLINKDNSKQFKPKEVVHLFKEFQNMQTEILNLEADKSIDLKLNNNNFNLIDFRISGKKEFPPPPFTTSSLQKVASQVFNFSPTKTMKIAQNLYEGSNTGGGLITYIRTDSTRVSEKAIKQAIQYIKSTYGIDVKNKTFRKLKEGIQDAHEAIRPTNLSDESKLFRLSEDEKKLYNLIKNRFVSSFLDPLEKKVAEGKISDSVYTFVFRIESITKKGFKEFSNEEIPTTKIPDWKKGERLFCEELTIEAKMTEPLSRYKESSLIDKMEKSGIGRPSTYAVTLETLFKRSYIQKSKNEVFPSELGMTVNDEIVRLFGDFISDDFSSKMEKNLDQISLGKKDRFSFLNEFYQNLNAVKKNQKHSTLTEKVCPICLKGNLKKKISREKKVYYLCSRFPYCEFAEYENPLSGEK